MRATANQLRGRLALRFEQSLEQKSSTFRLLDELGAILAATRNDLRALRADFVQLERRLEQAERQASEHKAKRADALARISQRDRKLGEIENSVAWKAVKPLWKLTRHIGKRRAEQPARDDVAFGIDLPAKWETSREMMVIKGWCFSRSGREFAGLRAKIGGKSYVARYGSERRDIAEMFGGDDSARRSGFAIEIKVPQGRSAVKLEAITLGGQWQQFYEHEVIGEPRTDDYTRTSTPTPRAGAAKLPRFADATAATAAEALVPRFAAHARNATGAPLFSIVTPTFNTSPQWFAEAAASILDQTFTDWEWCIVDDGSTDRETRKLLEKLSNVSARLKIRLGENKGIAAATNAALDMAAGQYVCFLDHDDLLDPAALQFYAKEVKRGCDAIYSDEDKLDDKSGRLTEPFYKPEWSPEYFRGAMYVGHFLCVRAELAKRVRFDSQYDGVQDFEFMLRVSETGAKICHVGELLYHWRKTPGSIAERSDAKPHITELQARAVNAHLARLGLPATAKPGPLPHRLQIIPTPRPDYPLVSIIIPTKDSPAMLERCLQSIRKFTSYPRFEIVIVDNGTTDRDALRIIEEHATRRVDLPDPFNFSRANNLAARAAQGDFLVFLNNDTEIITADWLEHLLYYADQPDVGASGALLVYADRTVQHAGVALGMRGTADHLMRGFPPDADGYAGSLACAREVSAVTAACMMMRKSLFEQIGGFNEHFFTAYQDVDLCMRLRARGLRIVFTPRTVVVHHEWTSRKTYYDMVDRTLLLDQWEPAIESGDPYYHRELNLERGDYSIAANGR